MADYPVRGLKPWDQQLKAYIDDSIDEAIADAGVGAELGYAQTTVAFSTTNSDPSSVAEASLISGLICTVVGNGRPAEIQFYAGQVIHNVAAFSVMPYFVINNAVGHQIALVDSPATIVSRSVYMTRRVVLQAGTTYNIRVGLRAQPNASPVQMATVTGSAATPISLTVVGR